MSQDNRIWFLENPWTEGHPIEEFEWTAEVREGVVWMQLHLKTAAYYSEREIEEEKDDYESDFQAPPVWYNYHRCTLSSTFWHEGGFSVCPVAQFSPAFLQGYEAAVDPLPAPTQTDLDDLAFHIYLLGHDAVAGHRIRFLRRGESDRFDIEWTGKIALAYAGDFEYRHDFKALIFDVQMPMPKP